MLEIYNAVYLLSEAKLFEKKGRQRAGASFCQFTPYMPVEARSGLGLKSRTRITVTSLMVLRGIQFLEPSLLLLREVEQESGAWSWSQTPNPGIPSRDAGVLS